MTIRLLLVDDHDLIRGGLRRAFEHVADVEVVAEATSCGEAVAVAASVHPDVTVVDVNLPDGNGIDVVRTLRQASPRMGIVVLTMYDTDEILFQALEAGASAFVTKSAPGSDLVAAVRHAAASPTAFTAADLVSAMRRKMSGDGVRLTPREAEILELLKLGLPVRTIASRLYISTSTAKTHISKLYEKLGATNRTQAVMAAIRLRLIESDDDTRVAQ